MTETDRPRPGFRQALAFWWKFGWISFGGPAGQISILHEELVEKRRWIGERQFLHGLNFAMLLPGPEAHQLATYIGWRMHGVLGGIAAGTLFLLPSVLLLWLLAWIYAEAGDVSWVAGVFAGLLPAVLAIVLGAVLRIGKKTLHHPLLWLVAGGAFVGIWFFRVPFPLIILSAAAAGLVLGWCVPRVAEHCRGGSCAAVGDIPSVPAHAHTGSVLGRWIKVTLVCMALWWSPVLVCGVMTGWDSVWTQMGLFFSKAALVTFGGAYAVLPYVAQQAVENHQWLGAEEMMTGLALAETTPGPLIMVLQFVGFLGGWNQPGGMSPLAAATLGALLTTWVTFLPCYFFIFLGAPHIERLSGRPVLATALTMVTAAVVGVIFHLALWFARQAFMHPSEGAQMLPLVLAAVYFIALQRFRIGTAVVIVVGALTGLAGGLFAA